MYLLPHGRNGWPAHTAYAVPAAPAGDDRASGRSAERGRAQIVAAAVLPLAQHHRLLVPAQEAEQLVGHLDGGIRRVNTAWAPRSISGAMPRLSSTCAPMTLSGEKSRTRRTRSLAVRLGRRSSRKTSSGCSATMVPAASAPSLKTADDQHAALLQPRADLARQPLVAVREHRPHRAPRAEQVAAGAQLLIDPGDQRSLLAAPGLHPVAQVEPHLAGQADRLGGITASRLLRCQASMALTWAVSRSS
jgi:hypothetical protein